MEISFRRVLSALLHLCHKVQVFKFIRLLSERERNIAIRRNDDDNNVDVVYCVAKKLQRS